MQRVTPQGSSSDPPHSSRHKKVPGKIKDQLNSQISENFEQENQNPCTFDDVLSGETLVVGARSTPEDLGGDDEVGSSPSELANGLAHDLLGATIGVHLGVVEEIDAVVATALEKSLRLLHIQLVSEAHPSAVR